MTTREGLVAEGALKTKRLRIRKCGNRLRLPTGRSETLFVCALEKHPEGTPHVETGYVFMSNGTARSFKMTWSDAGVQSLRQTPGRRRSPTTSKVTK